MTDSQGQSESSDNPLGMIKKKKLMIVEDDFFMRDLYEMQARNAGFDVLSVEDGEQALVKVKEFLPDSILMDVMLPKVDGVTVLKEIKADPQLKKIVCLIVTNLEDPAKEDEARRAGAVDYLLKVRNTPKLVIENLKKHL